MNLTVLMKMRSEYQKHITNNTINISKFRRYSFLKYLELNKTAV